MADLGKIIKKTAKQLLDMTAAEFKQLTVEEAKDAIKVLQKSANQRARRVQAAGIDSPAVKNLKTNPISAKSDDIDQLKSEFMKAKNFMESKTSTIPTYNEYDERQKEILAEQFGLPKDMSKKQRNRILKKYHELQRRYPSQLQKDVSPKYDRNRMKIFNMIRSHKSNQEIDEAMNDLYKRGQEEESEQVNRIKSGMRETKINKD